MIERPGARWRGSGCSHTGRVRSSNQDAFALLEPLGLWIVADGMGGHAGGEVASRIAVAAAGRSVEAQAGAGKTGGINPEALLGEAMHQANQAILNEARTNPELTGMGTTLDLLLITGFPQARAFLAHVGDSRVYLWRNGRLTQLTTDHSWVEEQVREGRLSSQAAAAHPLRHMLTRAVGTGPDVTADIFSQTLQAGDRLLLCTDGLTKMLSDAEILDILSRCGRRGGDACTALVERAYDKGGYDNTTVVLVTDQAD
jgi:protein phosphatase